MKLEFRALGWLMLEDNKELRDQVSKLSERLDGCNSRTAFSAVPASKPGSWA